MSRLVGKSSSSFSTQPTHHRLIIGDCRSMAEIPSGSIHLVVTSPPYYNAPFDSPNMFNDYREYLRLLESVATELFRVLVDGRIVVLNVDDMLVKGEKFPIVADATRIFLDVGFRYRDRLIWKKPDGYLRISRRSGVLLQNPFPLYFYPDNLVESVLILQKGRFDYRSVTSEVREMSRISVKEFQDGKWFSTLWQMTNVLPRSRLERGIAAFPRELPYRAIKLFSHVVETVLDPFCGSGTTMAVARELGRHSVGIEIQSNLVPTIRKKLGFELTMGSSDTFQVIHRSGSERVRCKPRLTM